MGLLFPYISNNSEVRCCFDTKYTTVPDNNTGITEIYFAKTNDLISEYFVLEKLVDKKDKLKADRFKFDEDRYTYLFCHTLLRLILSHRLDISPKDVLFIYDNNKKPFLSGNPLFFNISHTRDSFAFAISEQFRVGIDLENVDRNIDFNSILGKSFSSKECEFILEFPDDSRNRFFLLWTRKEALLKAIGSDISSNLSNIEVLKSDNFLSSKSFRNITDDSVFCDHYIYSNKISDCWLSVAVPQKAKSIIHHINEENPDNSNYLLSFLKSYH